jgi:hypothetical protein
MIAVKAPLDFILLLRIGVRHDNSSMLLVKRAHIALKNLRNYNPKKGVEIPHLIHPHPASPVQEEELKLPSTVPDPVF